eukprot:13195614-Alexandrium_andersonii.AAC.1
MRLRAYGFCSPAAGICAVPEWGDERAGGCAKSLLLLRPDVTAHRLGEWRPGCTRLPAIPLRLSRRSPW